MNGVARSIESARDCHLQSVVHRCFSFVVKVEGCVASSVLKHVGVRRRIVFARGSRDLAGESSRLLALLGLRLLALNRLRIVLPI